MSKNYQKKYMRYKRKYLALKSQMKSQSGGSGYRQRGGAIRNVTKYDASTDAQSAIAKLTKEVNEVIEDIQVEFLGQIKKFHDLDNKKADREELVGLEKLLLKKAEKSELGRLEDLIMGKGEWITTVENRVKHIESQLEEIIKSK